MLQKAAEANGSFVAGATVESQLASAQGTGSPLPASVRDFMEPRFGHSFNDVRIHANGTSADLSRSLAADAFTHGKDIFFASGKYAPGSTAGNELLAHELTHTVQQTGGNPLQRKESAHTAGCACAVCTPTEKRVQHRLTVGAAGDTYEQEADRIATQVMRMSETTPVTAQSDEETRGADGIAQRMNASAQPPGVQRRSPITVTHATGAIQRHAAFEHYLLGQVPPSQLAALPMVRAVRDQERESENQVSSAETANALSASMGGPTMEVLAARGLSRDEAIQRDNVKHTIEQEMDRLLKWKDNPEAASAAKGATGSTTVTGLDGEKQKMGTPKKGEDGQWQVPYILLPVRKETKDGPNESIVVTYSEMNTMPDLFGNPETIANTPKKNVLSLLQGVRQQSYIELDNMYKEIFGKGRSELSRTLLPDKDFKDAQGPRAQAVVDKAYEIRTEGQVDKATNRKGEESQRYFAALERNACHFAPESWASWEGYHTRARKFAEDAAKKRAAAAGEKDKAKKDKTIAESQELGNQAMIQNSFGEHYLQDSFAAGHLIDKTKIMQWFMAWLNAHDDGLGTRAKAQNEWAMASTMANQNIKSNPQAIDDMMYRSKDGVTPEQAAAAAGLETKDEILFMMWWRDVASQSSGKKHMTPQQAAKECPLGIVGGNAQTVLRLMNKLVEQNFAKHAAPGLGESMAMGSAMALGMGAGMGMALEASALPTDKTQWEYSLDQANIDVLKGKGPYKSTAATQRKEGRPDYAKEASEFNLAAYNAFLSNAYVQSSTKYFHDKYCKEGLVVTAANGTDLGRIYGDANMLKSGGQKGVQYSAETSQMSREAIFNLIDGHADQAAPTQTIRGRFPAKADGMPLDQWNQALKKQGEDKLFKEAQSLGAKAVYKFQDGISEGHALDVEKLTSEKSIEKQFPFMSHGGPF